MSDEEVRRIERRVLQGDASALEELKTAWARHSAYEACSRCGATVPAPGMEEHRRTCSSTQPRSGTGLIQIPIPGVVGARPRKHPYFHHAWLTPGEHAFDFFRDVRSDTPLWRTNFPAPGGSLPTGSTMLLYGISMVPDATSRPADVFDVWDTGAVELVVGNNRFHSWPMREIMGEQPRVAVQNREEDEIAAMLEARVLDREPARAIRLRSEGAVRDLCVSGRPIELFSQANFHVRVELGCDLMQRVGLMCVLYGIPIIGITG